MHAITVKTASVMDQTIERLAFNRCFIVVGCFRWRVVWGSLDPGGQLSRLLVGPMTACSRGSVGCVKDQGHIGGARSLGRSADAACVCRCVGPYFGAVCPGRNAGLL